MNGECNGNGEVEMDRGTSEESRLEKVVKRAPERQLPAVLVRWHRLLESRRHGPQEKNKKFPGISYAGK